MLPIILSAPHGGRESIPGVPVRRGIGVAQFTTERDGNTAELAEAIGRALGDRLDAKPFLIVARFERKYVDANRPHAAAYESAAAKPYYEAYHRALEDASERVRQRWMGGLLLDIHGQGAEADTIFRGTDNGRSISALQQKFGNEALTGPKSIVGQLALKGYKVIPNGVGDAREQRRHRRLHYANLRQSSRHSDRCDSIGDRHQSASACEVRSNGNRSRRFDRRFRVTVSSGGEVRTKPLATTFVSEAGGRMKACRECRREISEQAIACPHCGAPFPAREKWDGFGFEYKSKRVFFGWPLLHI
jgi:hypothetical protein